MKQFHKLIMFNVFGSSLGWAALGLGIAAVVSPNWISDGVNRRSGLWQLCQPSGCVNLQGRTSCLIVFRCIFILSPESDQSAITSLLRSCRPSVFCKMGKSGSVHITTAQLVNLPACFPYCRFNAERQAGSCK